MMGITYDYIAEDLQQQEGESQASYNTRLYTGLVLAETALMQQAEANIKTQQMIKELLEIIRQQMKITHPKRQPTMTAFDLGWTPTGTH